MNEQASKLIKKLLKKINELSDKVNRSQIIDAEENATIIIIMINDMVPLSEWSAVLFYCVNMNYNYIKN